MTTSEAHVVYYAESFCALSETYVYRPTQCLSSIAATTILAHDSNHRDTFPDAALDIWVEAHVNKT
jgi:hypothetical protein